jgi:hypothetical protein
VSPMLTAAVCWAWTGAGEAAKAAITAIAAALEYKRFLLLMSLFLQ